MAQKRSKDGPSKLRPDVAETAYRVMQEGIGERPKTKPPGERSEEEKHPEAVRRGARGAKDGGAARADALTPDRRAEIAYQAAKKRWRNKGKP